MTSEKLVEKQFDEKYRTMYKEKTGENFDLDDAVNQTVNLTRNRFGLKPESSNSEHGADSAGQTAEDAGGTEGASAAEPKKPPADPPADPPAGPTSDKGASSSGETAGTSAGKKRKRRLSLPEGMGMPAWMPGSSKKKSAGGAKGAGGAEDASATADPAADEGASKSDKTAGSSGGTKKKGLRIGMPKSPFSISMPVIAKLHRSEKGGASDAGG